MYLLKKIKKLFRFGIDHIDVTVFMLTFILSMLVFRKLGI